MKISFSAEIKSNNLYDINRINSLYRQFSPVKITRNDTYLKNTNAIELALSELEKIEFRKEDIKKIKRAGAKLIFKNGKEAVEFAKKKNIKIIFDKTDRPDIHAQWVYATNTITINDKYKNTNDKAEILAISAAILHELSHAKDDDEISSVQEEIDCLAMNALAFSVERNRYPDLFKNTKSPIISDGVNVYTDLFLGNDKNALAERINDKYGDLMLDSPNHRAKKLAYKIKT